MGKKAKTYGLFKKNLRKYTSIIIFSMKLYPYIPEKEKKIFRRYRKVYNKYK